MTPRGPSRPTIGLAILAVAISGCALQAAAQQQTGARPLALPVARPSILLVVTDPTSAAARKTTAALINDTTRSAERIVVLSDRNGRTLVSSTAPTPPSRQGPAPIPSLPAHATSFQKAEHAQAARRYQTALRRDRASLQSSERAGLRSWARSVIRQAETPGATRSTGTADVRTGLKHAAAIVSSLRQIGAGSGTPVAVAITGVSPAAARSTPDPVSGLEGTDITVAGFPGDSGDEAAWQSNLLQSGVTQVTMLGQATQDELPAVVGQDLDGTSPDTAATVRFGLGQYTLSATADPRLRRVLRLLTTRYSQSSVTITGYTDELPAPGGNLRLSERRAQSVAAWLAGHGVSPERLQAYGYGTADSVAVHAAGGQPLDRRVVIIIDPAVCGGFAGACAVNG